MTTRQPFIQHILSPVLPEQIPAVVTSSVSRPRAAGDYNLSQPGIEADFDLGDEGYAIVVHAVADADYLGQYAYFQIAKRLPEGWFGSWHYGFYYRGGDSPWDVWQLDSVYGTDNPTHASFGHYVSTCLKEGT